VGIDQEPHLEVAREIARKLNSLAGEDLFPKPQRFATKGEYVPSLTGEGKMSKSVEGSYITLQDSLSEITEKIAKMPTDTGKGNSVPTEGSVKNLLHFVDLFEGPEKKLFYENQYVEAGIKYSELKNDLAQAIYTELKPIQEKRAELEKKPDYIQKVIEQSAAKAREITQETLDQIKTLLGFQI